VTSSPASECIDLNAINLSLADLKRRHESASAPYVQAWQDVGLEDDRDASVVRGRREGPNAVVGVAPERDELVNLRRDGRIERGGAVFELVQRAGPQPVLVEPRILSPRLLRADTSRGRDARPRRAAAPPAWAARKIAAKAVAAIGARRAMSLQRALVPPAAYMLLLLAGDTQEFHRGHAAWRLVLVA